MTRGTWRYRAACKIAAFFTAFWYGLTQRAYRLFCPDVSVEPAKSLSEVSERLSFGKRWREDRWAGAMTHPACVQWNIDADEPVGDCEDHAGTWIAALHKYPEVLRTYMGIALFRDLEDDLSGHVVCLFTTAEGLFWTDYETPHATTWETWALEVAAVYESRLTFAYAMITTTDSHDTVRFGKCIPFSG